LLLPGRPIPRWLPGGRRGAPLPLPPLPPSLLLPLPPLLLLPLPPSLLLPLPPSLPPLPGAPLLLTPLPPFPPPGVCATGGAPLPATGGLLLPSGGLGRRTPGSRMPLPLASKLLPALSAPLPARARAACAGST
jgi:hypothetical protein